MMEFKLSRDFFSKYVVQNQRYIIDVDVEENTKGIKTKRTEREREKNVKKKKKQKFMLGSYHSFHVSTLLLYLNKCYNINHLFVNFGKILKKS